jgi:haloalkane dehalogenase
MDIVRTAEERFTSLLDYLFEPQYLDVTPDLRMHYLDEGPRDGPVALLMHGEPTWSYLYRHFIPTLTARGARVIAPDLIGFGKSDKPTAREDYSYAAHVGWMQSFLSALSLGDITLFAQDWGGLIGLRLVAAEPDRFARLMLGNTALPTGDHPMGAPFEQWRAFSQSSPDFPIGKIVHKGTSSGLSDAEIAAYDAPFPDERYKAGARAFPALVPARPDDPASADNRAAWDVLRQFEKPVLLCFSDEDMILGHLHKVFSKQVPGTQGQPHFTTPKAAHFLQEDAAPLLSDRLAGFMGL